MSRPARKLQEQFTYVDYLTWPDDERWELIHGVAYDMSPAPSPEHQRILLEIAAQFHLFLQGKLCQTYIAPFDVCFSEANEADDDIETVVQPDLSIICDPQKIDDRGCKGAPDLIVEILSPSTAGKDTQEKFTLYETHGVKEYWLVYPFEHVVEVFELGKDGRYGRSKKIAGAHRMPVALFPGLELDLGLVFAVKSPALENDFDGSEMRDV